MRPQVPVGPLTYDDVQQFPDDGLRYELVDGELLVSPSPGIAHQRCVTRLVGLLLAAVPAELEAIVGPYVHELVDGRFVERAAARGDEPYRGDRPFPVEVVPAGLTA